MEFWVGNWLHDPPSKEYLTFSFAEKSGRRSGTHTPGRPPFFCPLAAAPAAVNTERKASR